MPLNGEMKAMTDEKRLSKLDINGVKARMVTIRGQLTLLDCDVAELYDVATREINQAVRNNPGKFPEGYVVQMSESELSDWRSKILISAGDSLMSTTSNRELEMKGMPITKQ